MKLFVFAVLLLSVVSIDALNKQQDCKCRSQTSRRIVGGTVVSQSLHPWYANLTTSFPNQMPVLCGAIILNEKTLLTAGQCTPLPRNKQTITFMRVQINGEQLEVEDIITHENYTRIGYFLANNDLAIYKLKKPLTFNEQVQPACFNVAQQVNYSNLKIVGYGSTTPMNITSDLQIEGYNPSKNLREGLVREVTKEKCANSKDEFICVNGIEGRNKANPCLGDAGSGLIEETNGKSYVVGVIGFPVAKFLDDGKLGLCTSGAFTARLSAPTARNFIEAHVGDDYCH